MKFIPLLAEIALYTPWPPSTPKKMFEDTGDDWIFELWSQFDGSLRAVLTPKLRILKPYLSQSSKIEILGQGSATIRLAFELDESVKALEMRVNGSEMVRSAPPICLTASPIATKVDVSLETVDQEGIDAARLARKHRRISFEAEHGFEARKKQWRHLRELTKLLGEDVSRYMAGDEARLRTACGTLRTLVSKGRGNHVLQDCASFIDKDLFVWTKPPQKGGGWNPKSDESVPFFLEAGSISFSCKMPHTHKTDFESWLKQYGMTVEGIRMTNLEALRTITSQLGAHADVSKTTIPDHLLGIKIDQSNWLKGYMAEISNVVFFLANMLLSESEE